MLFFRAAAGFSGTRRSRTQRRTHLPHRAPGWAARSDDLCLWHLAACDSHTPEKRRRGAPHGEDQIMATAPTTNGNNGGAAANGGQMPEKQPQLNVMAQYVKDFSFENPNAPKSLAPTQTQPTISIQINVSAKPLAETDMEVELKMEGKAETTSTLLFSFDLTYAGVFRLQNIPQPDLQPVTMIECPRLLFPFAREIIANAVQHGGYPPLRIDPIDFVGLYRQRLAQEQGQAAPPPVTA
jgi:preprotein translocase subunit SecB